LWARRLLDRSHTGDRLTTEHDRQIESQTVEHSRLENPLEARANAPYLNASNIELVMDRVVEAISGTVHGHCLDDAVG
jgi:hypothetical protein